MRRGRILLLNGASSSGKTSLGRALLPLLPDPWFLVPADVIGALRSPSFTRELDDAEVAAVLRRTRSGYHRAVVGLAEAGNDVVMDYPLSEPWRLEELLALTLGYDVTLVDVWCAPEERARREAARGDRPAGLALSQEHVYDLPDRDLRVDTTHRLPEAAAAEVAALLVEGRTPTAFDRLRASA